MIEKFCEVIDIINSKTMVEGLVKRLRETFPGYRIFTENIEQGLSPPCFSVILEQPKIERFLGKRFFRRYDFCIYYFPESDKIFSEFNEVSEKLIPQIEFIEADGELIRGSNFSQKTVDDVMVISAGYGVFVYEDEKAPAMEKLNYNSKKGS